VILLSKSFLEASLWQRIPGDVFFSRYAGDETIHPEDLSPSSVYRPVSMVPSEIFVRTSEREKRLEFELKATEISKGHWGALYDVSGAGSQVGLVMTVNPVFIGAHVLPDIVHLLGNDESIAFDGIITDIHLAKTVRVFKVGFSLRESEEEHIPHDVVLTTKYRWFRNRNNPKHLGFSKEEK
jgi:hypothetical protein